MAGKVSAWPSRASARSSTDRASDYGSEGWEFESLRARRVCVQVTALAGRQPRDHGALALTHLSRTLCVQPGKRAQIVCHHMCVGRTHHGFVVATPTCHQVLGVTEPADDRDAGVDVQRAGGLSAD